MDTAEKTFDLGLTELEVISLSEGLGNILEEANTKGNNIWMMIEMAKEYTAKHHIFTSEILDVVRTYSSILEQLGGCREHLFAVQQKARVISDTL